RALGTPVDGVPWRVVNAMLYTSILEGWSRGAFGRRDARAFLGAACRAARARFGERAAASLGAVGPGALGDEPVYRSPAGLADAAASARAAGADALALFELAGVLGRPPAEAWLEAFVAPEPAADPPEMTLRARVALAAGRAAGAAFGLVRFR